MTNSSLSQVSQSTYQSFIEKGKAVVLFKAEWDVTSKMMEAVLARVSESFKDSTKFACVDVDDQSMWDALAELKIMRTPTIVIYNAGVPVHFIAGIGDDKIRELTEILDAIAHQE